MDRRLRFMQAVALLSTTAVAACAARTPLEEPADATETGASLPGRCTTNVSSAVVECRAVCGWNSINGDPLCVNASPHMATKSCGSISCSASCDCVDQRSGTCFCDGIVKEP